MSKYCFILYISWISFVCILNFLCVVGNGMFLNNFFIFWSCFKEIMLVFLGLIVLLMFLIIFVIILVCLYVYDKEVVSGIICFKILNCCICILK